MAALLALCVSCADGAEPMGDPVVQVGTGEWQFEPLTPGQHVPFVAGTQGGYHVWISVRASGFDGSRLRMKLDLVSASSAPPAHTDVDVVFEPADDVGEGTWQEKLGWPAQLLDPWCAVERPLTVRVTVSDRSGRTASTEASLVPAPPVRPFAQTCAAP